MGAFRPKCKADGWYASVQCHGSTGFCWCADKDGNEIADTATRGQPDCAKSGEAVGEKERVKRGRGEEGGVSEGEGERRGGRGRRKGKGRWREEVDEEERVEKEGKGRKKMRRETFGEKKRGAREGKGRGRKGRR